MTLNINNPITGVLQMQSELIVTDSLTKFYGQIKGIEDISVKIPSGNVRRCICQFI